jgi:hypothetical protein
MSIDMKVAVAAALAFSLATPALAQDFLSGPVSLANGVVTLGSDIAVSATPQDDTNGAWFNYTDYEHNALRLFRIGVTADVRVTSRVSVLTEIRSENGDGVKPYALYLRVRPWRDRPIDIQAGRIPPTFGAFARRDYGAGNPLIGYPLAYQYLTTVRPDALAGVERRRDPHARARLAAELSARLAQHRARHAADYRISMGYRRTGARRPGIAERGRRGDHRHGVGSTHARQQRGANRSSDAPSGGPTRGSYWEDRRHEALMSLTRRWPRPRFSPAMRDRSSRRSGLDVELSRNYWLVRGELIWNQWQVPTLSHSLDAASGFVEGTYKVSPGFFRGGPLRQAQLRRAAVFAQQSDVGCTRHADRDGCRLLHPPQLSRQAGVPAQLA